MRRDPFFTLSRLRRLETRAAQGRLAGALAQLAAQQAAAEAVEAELRRERPEDAPASYGDFLARILAARQRQAAAVARAQAVLDAERDALAATRAAEKVVDALRERRAAAVRRDAARRAQARLDEVAQRLRD